MIADQWLIDFVQSLAMGCLLLLHFRNARRLAWQLGTLERIARILDKLADIVCFDKETK